MKGTKCPYCESSIPILHVLFKLKKLSKEHEDRNRKSWSLRFQLNCLPCEQDFEIKFGNMLMSFLLFFISSTIGHFIFKFFVNGFLFIDGWFGTLFLPSFLKQLSSLFVFILMLKFLNSIFITTWPIREISE